MNPQEQAQAVKMAAARARCLDSWNVCQPMDSEWNGCHLCAWPAGDAAAIRAAVDLVLPKERSLCDRSWQRMIKRAEFLAIAAALDAPANG